MNKSKTISEQLRALAENDDARTKIARLRDVFDDIEAALAAGVSQSRVVKNLSDNGLVMTLGTFKSMLQRIRKERGKLSNAPGQSDLQNKTVDTPREKKEESENSNKKSSDPAELDKIFSQKNDISALAESYRRRKK
jgi:hypothetical protein